MSVYDDRPPHDPGADARPVASGVTGQPIHAAAGGNGFTPPTLGAAAPTERGERLTPVQTFPLDPAAPVAPAPPALPSDRDPSVRGLVEFAIVAVRRHLGAGFAVGFLICLLTAAYLYFAPRAYLSAAKLYVRLGRESITIDPTASTGETMQVAESRENQINSVLEIISSENIYDEVVRRLGPDVVLGEAPVPPLDAPPTDSTARSYIHREAVKRLQKKIDLDVVKRSNIIWVTAEAGDPLLAQRILQTFLDASEQLYLDSTRSDGTVELFVNESKRVEQRYDQEAKGLAEVKSRIGVASIDDRRKTLQEQLSKSESDIDQAEARLAKAEATVDSLAESLVNVDQFEMSRTSNQPQDARGQANRDVAKLQIKEQELLAKYTERHPSVVRVREQIARANELLAEAKAPEQETATISPVWRTLEQDRQRQLAEIRATKAELASLRSSRQAVRLRLSELNDVEGEIAGREELLKVLRETRADYAEKLQQARMDEVMASQSLSDISIPQPATYQPKAIAPKKRLIAAAGVVFAALAALLTMLGLEGWDRGGGHLKSLIANAA